MRVEFRVYRMHPVHLNGEKVLVTEFETYEAAETYIREKGGAGEWTIEKVFIK